MSAQVHISTNCVVDSHQKAFPLAAGKAPCLRSSQQTHGQPIPCVLCPLPPLCGQFPICAFVESIKSGLWKVTNKHMHPNLWVRERPQTSAVAPPLRKQEAVSTQLGVLQDEDKHTSLRFLLQKRIRSLEQMYPWKVQEILRISSRAKDRY